MANDLERRVGIVEYAVHEIKDSVKSIAVSLHTLTSLEVKHEETREALSRAFREIEAHDLRLETIENVMPGLKEVRGWAVRGLLGIVGAVGVAVLGLVIVSGKVEVKIGELRETTEAAAQQR